MAYYQNYSPYAYQQQMMSPPTIRAEIVQVDNEQAAANYPVGTGMSQMMIAKDESAIFVKSVSANGAVMDVYIRRPPAPPEPKFVPGDYVRKDEIAEIVAAMLKKEENNELV